MNQAETYYLKAVSHFPFDFSEVCESLNYALSHNPNYAPALCLKAKIYLSERMDFALAKTYFEQAIAADPTYTSAYAHYGELLLQTEAFDLLEPLIDQSFKVPGINKGYMYQLRARMYEYQRNYSKALLTLELAAEDSYHESMCKGVEEDRKRIEDKTARKSAKPKKTKKSKKDSKKNTTDVFQIK